MFINKYSIILPVRNGGSLVKECVQSVLSQTFQNFSLLILDNNSNDGTSEWLATLTDNRIKIFPSSNSLSIEDNWKRILDIPKNEFATLIGHDDVLMPDYLNTIDRLVQLYPDASLFQTSFIFIDSEGTKIRDCLPMPKIMATETFISNSLQRIIDINGTGFMFRSTMYDSMNGIPLFPKLMFADYALWFSMAKNGYVAVAKNPAFKYRIHQNTSQTADPVIYSNALKEFVNFLKVLKADHRLQESIKAHAPEFITHYCKSICHKLLRLNSEERENITVSQITTIFENECKDISEKSSYSLKNDPGIKAALLIDSNKVTRFLFRKFRKFYDKPIFK